MKSIRFNVSDTSKLHNTDTTVCAGNSRPAASKNLYSQITLSSEPPLTTNQARGLQTNGITALDYYTQALPGLKDLRRRARSLARDTAGLAQSDKAGDARSTKRRMALEGEVLLQYPYLSLHDAQYLLDQENITPQARNPRVPYADSLKNMEKQLDALFNNTSEALPTYEIVCETLEYGLSNMAKHLEGHHAFYHNVLQSELKSAERKQIQAGCRALERLAGFWSEEVKRLLEKLYAQACKRMHIAITDLNFNDVRGRLSIPERQHAVEFWRAISEHLVKLRHSFIQNGPFATALQHVHLDETVEVLHSCRRGIFTLLLSACGASIPDAVAAGILYVVARSTLPPSSVKLHIAAQSLLQGSTIGVAHEILEKTVKPAMQEIISNFGMREPHPIDVRLLIPDAPQAIVLSGRYHERSECQQATAQKNVEQARIYFNNRQKDYKAGTLRGDALTFFNLSTAQMIRSAVEVNIPLNASAIPVRTITSFGGKFAARFSQAQGQLLNSFRNDGRDLPTHIPAPAPDEVLTKRLKRRAQEALSSSDPRDREARTNYASKAWSATEGMLAFNAVGRTIIQQDPDTSSGAAYSIALSGIQTLGFQMPFEANNRSSNEAKEDETSRVMSAIANVLAPDRISLAHGTQEGTFWRQIENLYNRVRGVEQLPAQIATAVTECIADHAIRGIGRTLNTAVSSLTSLRTHSANAPLDLERNSEREG